MTALRPKANIERGEHLLTVITEKDEELRAEIDKHNQRLIIRSNRRDVVVVTPMRDVFLAALRRFNGAEADAMKAREDDFKQAQGRLGEMIEDAPETNDQESP